MPATCCVTPRSSCWPPRRRGSVCRSPRRWRAARRASPPTRRPSSRSPAAPRGTSRAATPAALAAALAAALEPAARRCAARRGAAPRRGAGLGAAARRLAGAARRDAPVGSPGPAQLRMPGDAAGSALTPASSRTTGSVRTCRDSWASSPASTPRAGSSCWSAASSRHLLPELPESWRLVEVDAPGYSLREQAVVLTRRRPRAGVGPAARAALRAALAASRAGWWSRSTTSSTCSSPSSSASSLGFAYARISIRAAVRRARRVVTVSRTTADDLQAPVRGERGAPAGDPPRRARGVPRRRRPGRGRAGCARRLGVARPYLLHVGNHKPHKNAEGLLKAYQTPGPRRARRGAAARHGRRLRAGRRAGAARRAPWGSADRVRCLGHVERARAGGALPRRRRVRLPDALRGVRPAGAGGDGVRRAGGGRATSPAVREVAGDAVRAGQPARRRRAGGRGAAPARTARAAASSCASAGAAGRSSSGGGARRRPRWTVYRAVREES